MTNQITPASDIIREAEAVSELSITELVYQLPGTIANPMYGEHLMVLAALETLQGNGYVDDDWSSPAEGDRYIYRIDRWIVKCDSDGFRNMQAFDTEALAKSHWRSLGLDHSSVDAPDDQAHHNH